jgi:hypothetical protein
MPRHGLNFSGFAWLLHPRRTPAANIQGANVVAPMLRQFGTAEQQDRYLVEAPSILRCSH